MECSKGKCRLGYEEWPGKSGYGSLFTWDPLQSRSIYSPEQLEEFSRFQESQGTRRAFLAESAERAYNTRVGDQWGSGLSDLATTHLLDAVGHHLVPMYRYIGPTATVALVILFLMS